MKKETWEKAAIASQELRDGYRDVIEKLTLESDILKNQLEVWTASYLEEATALRAALKRIEENDCPCADVARAALTTTYGDK